MSLVTVWPKPGVNVPKPEGGFYASGETVVLTRSVQRAINRGDLLTSAPGGPAPLSPVAAESIRKGLLATDLSALVGPYDGAVVFTIGRTVAGTNADLYYWDSTSTAAESAGSVYGTGTVGRWKSVGLAGGSTAPAYTGLTRFVVFAIGESGMHGANAFDTDVPSDYPDMTGKISVYNASGLRASPLISENKWGNNPIDTSAGFDEANNTIPRTTWAGRFCQLIAATMPSTVEVMLVLCGKGGSTSTQWAVGGTLYTAAMARVNAALALPGATLGCILVDQGINDMTADPTNGHVGWDTRWSAIETGIRSALGNTQVPLLYRAQYQSPDYPSLRTVQQSWAKSTVPKRLCITSPNGPFDPTGLHLQNAPQFVQAQSFATAASGNLTVNTPSTALTLPTRAELLADSSIIELFDMSAGATATDWTGGKGGVCTQATSGKRPTLLTDAGNGKPAYRFTAASNQYWTLPSNVKSAYTAGTGFACFIAYRAITLGSTLVSLAQATGENMVTIGTAGSGAILHQRFMASSSAYLFATTYAAHCAANMPSVVGAWYDTTATSAKTKLYIQSGLEVYTAADSGSQVVPTIVNGALGCYLVSGNQEYFLYDGYISGVVFANPATLTAAKVERIMLYLYSIRP